MSTHHQADQTPTPRYKPYKGPAGGWGALISVAQAWLTSDNALKNLRMMLKTNQNGGFDCPGCAWGDSPESGMVKFCENGAKAVNWEATKRRVDGAFFAKHSVTSLLEQSDYWLEYQGRLTEPMRYAAGFVAHVRAVGEVVGAVFAHEQLVQERGFVRGAARGVEDLSLIHI